MTAQPCSCTAPRRRVADEGCSRGRTVLWGRRSRAVPGAPVAVPGGGGAPSSGGAAAGGWHPGGGDPPARRRPRGGGSRTAASAVRLLPPRLRPYWAFRRPPHLAWHALVMTARATLLIQSYHPSIDANEALSSYSSPDQMPIAHPAGGFPQQHTFDSVDCCHNQVCLVCQGELRQHRSTTSVISPHEVASTVTACTRMTCRRQARADGDAKRLAIWLSV